MQKLKLVLIAAFIYLLSPPLYSQDITRDTTQANSFYETAYKLLYKRKADSVIYFLDMSKKLYIPHVGENSVLHAKSLHLYGMAYYLKNEYDITLDYFFRSEKIYIQLLGEKCFPLAECYESIARIYLYKEWLDKSISYLFKAVDIIKANKNENSRELAAIYSLIGNVYRFKNEIDLSRDYYLLSLQISKNLFGENSIEAAAGYGSLAVIYDTKKEFNTASDYYLKAFEITKAKYGDMHAAMTNLYHNMGAHYAEMGQYDLSLDYYFKALELRIKFKGEVLPEVISNYNNIGYNYIKKETYDLALENLNKAYKIDTILKKDNIVTPLIYKNFALLYSNTNEFDLALKNYNYVIAACTHKYLDTTNIINIPNFNEFYNGIELLNALRLKAKILMDSTKKIMFFNEHLDLNRRQIALNHFLACDSLISKVRKKITTQSDKIALGETASGIYKDAANLCFELGNTTTSNKIKTNFFKQSFYYSERNKSALLLEALAGSHALKFTGIPQELLDKEHNLSIDIANYSSLKNNTKNDSLLGIYNKLLFNANRDYESLIRNFESNYPKYFQLKYNNTPVEFSQIQKVLDKKTAMLSYFVLDSAILIYGITNNGYKLFRIDKIEKFDFLLEKLYKVIQSNKDSNAYEFCNLAHAFFKQLFPKELLKNLEDHQIENLVIIPDGKLSIIPFESLLMEEYKIINTANYTNMPFVIKKFAISYSYSATLFYNTFSIENNKQIEIKKLNDFIAFAPVFDDEGITGSTEVSKQLLKNLYHSLNENTIASRGFLKNGLYVNPLLGTLVEVDSIFKLFNSKGLVAVAKTHFQANEEFVKSGALANYKYIHFATHGFANTEKPELSGILLAQNTVSTTDALKDIYGKVFQQNDGILYQSEIYNFKLNADLVVLSACETGLGKIISGEGVIGLTRALLYAGTKNIIVSLWEVSDESTTELMIKFYTNLLNGKSNEFNKQLQNAKLKMIAEGTYAHPYYWSPFILIGK